MGDAQAAELREATERAERAEAELAALKAGGSKQAVQDGEPLFS